MTIRSRAATSLVCTLMLASCLALPGAAAAQSSNEEQAKSFFKVARQLANRQRYAEAVQALEEAYGLVQRPSLLYWMAVTWREKHYRDGDVADLERAVTRYEDFLKVATDADADKRSESISALGTLRPLLERLRPPEVRAPTDGEPADGEPPDGEPADGPPIDEPGQGGASPVPQPASPASPGVVAPTVVVQTGIMASSPTPDVLLELDGQTRSRSPLIAEVSPGDHRLVVRAPGFLDRVRDIHLEPGQVLALDVELDEAPSVVALRGPEGASVTVDGTPRGELPLAGPLVLPPGERFVAVTQNGHAPYSQILVLGRGQREALDIDLPTTGQRYAAWATFGAGAAGIALGGIFTGLAVAADEEAGGIVDRLAEGDLPAARVGDYDDARSRRDGFRTAAITSFALGGLALGAGTALFVLDEPTVRAPLWRQRRETDRPALLGDELELSLTPLVGPRVGGATLEGKF